MSSIWLLIVILLIVIFVMSMVLIKLCCEIDDLKCDVKYYSDLSDDYFDKYKDYQSKYYENGKIIENIKENIPF